MDPKTLVIHGTTSENTSNLDPDYLPDMEARIGGTRMGDQELEALIPSDNESALVSSMALIDRRRVERQPKLVEVGVGVDPAVSTKRRNDESGIVVAGKGEDGHLYALAEESDKYEQSMWALAAVKLEKE